MGFEPTISCVTDRRPLQAGLRGRKKGERGREEGGREERVFFPLSSSNPGWTRTTDGLLVRQLLLPLSHGTKAETEGIEPPTLAGSCFQGSVLDQPDSLLRIVNQAATARIERALTRSKRVVRTFTLRRINFVPLPAGPRRIERRPSGSEPVVRPLHQGPVRVGGIEPPPSVWKTDVLPLHHTRAVKGT
jgi:hypothetical protein